MNPERNPYSFLGLNPRRNLWKYPNRTPENIFGENPGRISVEMLGGNLKEILKIFQKVSVRLWTKSFGGISAIITRRVLAEKPEVNPEEILRRMPGKPSRNFGRKGDFIKILCSKWSPEQNL